MAQWIRGQYMKNNKLYISIIVALVTALLILVSQATQASAINDTSHQVSVIVNDSNSDRWIRFRAGLDQAAKDYNINLNYVTTTKLDTFSQEKTLIDEEVGNGTEAVILQLVNDTTDSQNYITDMSHKTTLALVEAGLETSPSNKSYGVTQDDNAGMGEALAQMVIDRTDNHTKETIGIVTGDSFSAKARYNAMVKLFAEKNITVSWVIPSTEELPFKLSEQSVSTVVTLDNDTLEETATLFKDAKQKPQLYGVGCSDKSIYYLDNGKIAGMIVPNEYTMGYLSLSKVAMYLNDHLYKISDSVVNYFTITKENLYSTENQKMIFPIVG